MKEEQDQRPRWFGDYSCSNVNSDSLPISTLSNIQYFWVLDHLIIEVMIANPDLGTVYVLKSYLSDGLYHIALQPGYAPKISLVFPLDRNGENMVEIPITLPMEYKTIPSILFAATNSRGPGKLSPALQQVIPAAQTRKPRRSISHG